MEQLGPICSLASSLQIKSICFIEIRTRSQDIVEIYDYSKKSHHKGICSKMASRTRHFESSASSIIAGINVLEKISKPITSFTHLILLIMFNRTSAQSSLRKTKKKLLIFGRFTRKSKKNSEKNSKIDNSRKN